MLKFPDPKKSLLEMVKKFDREPPRSRSVLHFIKSLHYSSVFSLDCSKKRADFQIPLFLSLVSFLGMTSWVKVLEGL